ncbi:MAG TPA: BON domain-containing protein [Candidatus Sulfotelmatobacter sp.]|jgi:hyperosmotically inducible protein|nr:BON domain-containing protein [Candidatus Sulfotelmatobacter sp.]
MARRHLILAAAALLLAGSSAQAQISTILTAPKTLIDRAIEARSVHDIAEDNRIVAEINAAMAEMGTIKASTEIYEQRLLITGIFSDKATYDGFLQKVKAVKGVKKLYWHVLFMSDADQKAAHLQSWAETVAMGTKAQARLVGTAGVADVNFRVTADSTGTLYLLGRARSAEEARKALARVRDGDKVKKVVDYVDVRP